MPESAHVLVFPYPAQGRMIPLLDVAGHLAAAGVAVTIPVTPKNLHHLTSLLSAHPNSISPLLLPFPPHPSIPSGVENNADLPPSLFRSMMCAVAGLRRPLLDWFRRHPSPPSAIISDMFLGWVNRLAADLGIRSYAFFPSGAFAISFIRELWSEMPQRVNAGDDDEIVRFDGIPSSPVCAWWQITLVYRSYVKGDPDSEFIRDLFLGNFVSHGLIFNSFDGLEGVHLEYLAKKMGHDRVWAVGPLLPRIGPAERGGSSVVVTSDIQSWLDKCQDHTVVYVYFGSQTMLANDQMKELISGLERSGVKFIL